MLRSLFAAALVFAAGTAVAAERWETIPTPPPMPKADESGMADVNGIKMYYTSGHEGRLKGFPNQ
jgi:hypothetical protein